MADSDFVNGLEVVRFWFWGRWELWWWWRGCWGAWGSPGNEEWWMQNEEMIFSLRRLRNWCGRHGDIPR